MSELLYELKGYNGQLELYEDKIVIKRKALLAKIDHGFFKGDKTIYINQIAAIQVKPGTLLAYGYIQITVPGSFESKKGLIDAMHDENTVMFFITDNKLVNQIKSKIEELMSRQRTGYINQLSSADEIKKFKELLDDGLITQEEFDKRKNSYSDYKSLKAIFIALKQAILCLSSVGT